MANRYDLDGGLVLVTGASSGIGRETARLLSACGCRVILTGRDQRRLDESLSLLEGSGHVVKPHALNDLDGVSAWMQQIAEEHGPLTGLVHCAGIQYAVPLRAMNMSSVVEMFNVNVFSAIALIKGLRQRTVRSPTGAKVVLVSSVMGLVGQPLQAAYGASKGAIVALVKAAGLELAAENIRVNGVAPALVSTDMEARLRKSMPAELYADVEKSHPLGIGKARDVSDVVAFLLSSAADWMTGTVIVVDGGYSAR